MKKTEQYGLNQWELTDRVLMEDFNADNAKIAAALAALSSGLDSNLGAMNSAVAGKLGRLELIETYMFGSGTLTNNSLMFYQVDWSQWDYAFLTHWVSDTSHAATTIRLEFNPTGEIATVPYGSAVFAFPIHHDVTKPIRGILLAKDTVVPFYYPQYTFQQLTHFRIYPDASMPNPWTSLTGIR